MHDIVKLLPDPGPHHNLGMVAVPVSVVVRKTRETPNELFATEAVTLTEIGVPGDVLAVIGVQVNVAPRMFRAASIVWQTCSASEVVPPALLAARTPSYAMLVKACFK
jgi:hypothetical protein